MKLFEDFSISIVFTNRQKEKIVVEGVSKKGQNLLTYVPNGIDQRLKDCFSQAVNIKINFSPVLDLVKRLYTAFSNPDIIKPWNDFNTSVPPIHFIYGPPGTGKTTLLCNLLIEKFKNNPTIKALLLVPTNKAGDVLAKKLYKMDPDISIAKIGNPTDPELEALDPDIYQPSLNDMQFDGCNLVISTIHRLPYYQIAREQGGHYRLYSNDVSWDYLIFDESSMISLPYMIFALMALSAHAPETKIIVAGDPKQIPPIVDTTDKDLENLDMDDESIYKMFGIKSFCISEQLLVKRGIDVIENLSTQYRSVESIGKLYSQFSYEDLLKHGRNLKDIPIKELPSNFIKELSNPICLIDFPIDTENSVLTPKKLLYSSYHVYAGILTSELIRYLDICNSAKSSYTIGVVSPYKAQAMLMNKLILSLGITNNIQVICDTVHGFQGDECDIIIFLINPNNSYYTGHKNALLSKEYIYNVAMSRAKDHLWIINPFNFIRNNPFVEKIKCILNIQNSKIISSSKIENIIFGSTDFIVKNSY